MKLVSSYVKGTSLLSKEINKLILSALREVHRHGDEEYWSDDSDWSPEAKILADLWPLMISQQMFEEMKELINV